MPDRHKIHLADMRAITSQQDYTATVCKEVVGYRFVTRKPTKVTCKVCVRKAQRMIASRQWRAA